MSEDDRSARGGGSPPTRPVSVWPAYWLRNYTDYANALERLTARVEKADQHLVK